MQGLAGDEFADGVFGARGLAFGQRRNAAVRGVAQAAGAHGPGGESAAHAGVVDGFSAICQFVVAAEVQQLAEAGHHAGADGHALVHQRGQRYPPAVADGAQALVIGHTQVGEIHLVEAGLAIDLFDRADVDAGALHVDEEHRQAAVFGDVGIGAGQDDAVVRIVGAAGPDFLAVDQPIGVANTPAVACLLSPGTQAGQVRAGGGLGEELAPDLGA